MNIRVLVWTICLLLGEHPAAEWLDSTAGACSPLKTPPNGFPRWRGSRPRQWRRVSRSRRVLTGSLVPALLGGVSQRLIVVSICTSLMIADDVQHLFICRLAIHIFFGKLFVQIFWLFLN